MKTILLSTILLISVLFTLQASAHCHKKYVFVEKRYVPTATCNANSSLNQYPQYVCCELLSRHGHHIWRDTWVAGSCKNADPRAHYDMGCDITSPVYTTGAPILGACQFSYSTGRYL